MTAKASLVEEELFPLFTQLLTVLGDDRRRPQEDDES
jgi:hypothetical protein